MRSRPHIVYVLTSSLAARRMFPDYGRIWLASDVRVTIISSPGPDLDRFGRDEDVEIIGVPIERELSPLSDVRSLFRLWRTMRRLKPDLVECGTPKAGLLGGLAAVLAGVPSRVYTLHGLRFETSTGWKRLVLKYAERVSAFLSHQTIAVSHGLLSRAHQLAAFPRSVGTVAGPGSAAGINATRFATVSRSQPKANTIGFIGRLTRDKGITELVDAFVTLQATRPSLGLLLVGDFEAGDPVPARTQKIIQSNRSIRRTGFVEDAAPYYSAIDIVALPSYREGFPLVALEAAAAARPIVASNCTGMRDAVLHGRTGLIVPVGNAEQLATALSTLLDDTERAKLMGRLARGRVIREFQPEFIWTEKQRIYSRLLADAPFRRLPVQRMFKRAFDIIASASLLLMLAPVIPAIAFAVLVAHGRPVRFRQARPGFRARPITIQKFRTMTSKCDNTGTLLPDHERLTTFGRCLRRWSLDELPQLWSVLRGEMSLVGPRPLLTDYLDRYTAEQKARFLVKPGITGWAQVNGRNSVDWDARLAMDSWYANNWNLRLDLRILLQTLRIVVTGWGVEANGAVTPPPFLGTLQRRH